MHQSEKTFLYRVKRPWSEEEFVASIHFGGGFLKRDCKK